MTVQIAALCFVGMPIPQAKYQLGGESHEVRDLFAHHDLQRRAGLAATKLITKLQLTHMSPAAPVAY